MTQRHWMEARPAHDFPLWLRLAAPFIWFFHRLRHWDWSSHKPTPSERLSEVIQRFPVQVFGLLDGYRGLKQMGYSYGSDESVGVNFRAGPIPEPTLGLRIENKVHKGIEEAPPAAAAHFRDITLKMAAHGAAFEFGPQWFREAQVHAGKSLDIMNPLPESAWEALADPGLRLGGLKVTSPVLRYQAPTLVHAFRMENEDLEALISTSGFQTSELAELLSHIGPINDRPDIWERYERETAERVRELGHDPSVDA